MADQDVAALGATHVKADSSMQISQEPSKDESKAEVEETTQKTEAKASDKPRVEETTQVESKPKEKAEGGAKHPSQVISDLGEDRKRLAESLIELARESDSAAEQVKSLIKDDPSLERLFKTKFGRDYDALIKGKLEEEEMPDRNKIREEERIKIKAELIQSEIKKTKENQLITYAKTLGFTSDELEMLRKYADALDEGDYEKALKKASLVVNEEKARDESRFEMPRGGQETKPPKTKGVQITPAMEIYAKNSGRSAAQVAKGLERVEENYDPETGILRLGNVSE